MGTSKGLLRGLQMSNYVMTKQQIEEIWYTQLAFDYSCSVEELKSSSLVLAKKAYHPKRRIFRGDDCFCKLLIVNGKLVVNAEDENFLEDNRAFFEQADAAWFFEPDSMRALEKRLRSVGHTIADRHHFYLPEVRRIEGDEPVAKMTCGMAATPTAEMECGMAVMPVAEVIRMSGGALHWYEQEELERFRGDARFTSALSFIPQSPDMLAVTWEEDGEICGMAAASADCEEMWQIGINVLSSGAHRGLGTLLVTQLKEEILRRGKVPFYGTAESHIRSQRVAFGSGFMPAWAELYTQRV